MATTPIEMVSMAPGPAEENANSSPGASTPMAARQTRMAQLQAEVEELQREQDRAAARRIDLEARIAAEQLAGTVSGAVGGGIPAGTTLLTHETVGGGGPVGLTLQSTDGAAAAAGGEQYAEQFQMTPLESFSDTVHPTPLAPPRPTSEMELLLARFAQMQADMAAMKLTVERTNP